MEDGNPISLFHRSTRIEVGSEDVQLPYKPACGAVFFDLDGVITVTDQYHYRAWKHITDKLGWHFDKKFNNRLRGISRADSLRLIAEHNGKTLFPEEILALTTEINDIYRQSLRKLGPGDILPGIAPLFRELKTQGIKMEMASAGRNAAYILDHLGLMGVVDYIVSAETVCKGKSDPEIFLTAAEALDLFPEECVGIEDAQAGITAISAAGMKSIGVGEAVEHMRCGLFVHEMRGLTFENIRKLFV